ncbi:metallophosphoesterase [Paenibacillus sp. HJGM_3]|uniref:metallophosphoesterase n=1 Tax=Paenibacillus sp. HJGM_3 TaxID=3379816 RepID=UPI00385B49AE
MSGTEITVAAAALLVAAVIALVVWVYQTWVVDVVRVSLPSPLEAGVRLVQLSDLHGKTRFWNGSISDQVNRLEPDVVLITGDLTNRLTQRARVIAELSRIRCGQIVFIPGNHEWYEYRFLRKMMYPREHYEETMRQLRHAGIVVLENAYTVIPTPGGRVAVCGFDNSFYGNEKPVHVPADEQAAYIVALGHAPGIVRFLRRERIDYDLLLAGHTHGGQIRLLGWSYGIAQKYHVGLKRLDGGRAFYISRGLGNVHLPIRLGSRPELTLFELEGSRNGNG